MSNIDNVENCISCGRSEAVVPLIALRFAAGQSWICSQCLPILIHKPQQLAGKLAGAEQIAPAPSEH